MGLNTGALIHIRVFPGDGSPGVNLTSAAWGQLTSHSARHGSSDIFMTGFQYISMSRWPLTPPVVYQRESLQKVRKWDFLDLFHRRVVLCCTLCSRYSTGADTFRSVCCINMTFSLLSPGITEIILMNETFMLLYKLYQSPTSFLWKSKRKKC